jgi:hypothetical protein
VLGTENKWRYDSFVNWDFFPSIHLPILVYFKETQVSALCMMLICLFISSISSHTLTF